MPSKKKKFNARFPPARIKKIMQTDEEVGKVAAPVPVIISRALEMFIDTLIEKTAAITRSKNAKTLSSSHVKQAIHSEKTFDFLRDLVKNVPDHQVEEEIDIPMSSCSYTEKTDKKLRIQRQKKPREKGAKGPGRPKKVKDEKKDCASEVPDEEEECEEDQSQDEDSNDQSSLPDQILVPHKDTIHDSHTTELKERPLAQNLALPREQTDDVLYQLQNHQSIAQSFQSYQTVHTGFLTHHLSFPCSGTVSMISNPYISPQQNVLPKSSFKLHEMSSVSPRYVSSTHPDFVMSHRADSDGQQQLNLPQPVTSNLHRVSMVPTTSSQCDKQL